jgi:hypothetical protein
MGMPGHMGDERVTVQNLQVMQVRESEKVILISGAVPGANGSYVVIRPAIKTRLPRSLCTKCMRKRTRARRRRSPPKRSLSQGREKKAEQAAGRRNERESFNQSSGQGSKIEIIEMAVERRQCTTRRAMRAARRSGPQYQNKAEVDCSAPNRGARKGRPRPAGYNHRPIWSGGGVVFGPKPRDYSKKVSKSCRRLAFQKALSERIKAGNVLTVDKFAYPESENEIVCRFVRKTDRRRKVC